MLKHILVPLDGSELAEDVLEHIQRILDTRGFITLVTAISLPDYIDDDHPFSIIEKPHYLANIPDLMPGSKDYLDNVATGLRSEGYEVEHRVTIGDPSSVIVDLAEALEVDAIVMSTHGHSGLSHWMIGSVIFKVLNLALCPMIIVPSRKKYKAGSLLDTQPNP